MNIIVISVFCSSNQGRQYNILKYSFPNSSYKVITTNFNHRLKQPKANDNKPSDPNIVRLKVPGYNRNVSIKRIYSHLVFACKLRKYLNSLNEMPDLVYCAMPTSTSAYIAGRWCNKKDIPFIIDIIDLWPDSLIPIIPFSGILKKFLFPWQKITQASYKMADYIIGESKKYAEEGHIINKNAPYYSTYLGVDSTQTKELISHSSINLNKPIDEIWIGYGGSLGHSYDFDTILKGITALKQKEIKYKMWFIGGGEKEQFILNYAKEQNLNIEVTGRLSYPDLLKHLTYCDIAVNAFKEGTLVAHSYKFNDYVATDCFILNNLPGETARMIDEYRIGANFNKQTFSEILLDTIQSWNIIKDGLKQRFSAIRSSELETSVIYKRLGRNILSQLMVDKK